MSITPDTIRHLVSFCCLVDTFGDFLQIYLCMSKILHNFAHSFTLWEYEAVILPREKFNAHGNEEKT